MKKAIAALVFAGLTLSMSSFAFGDDKMSDTTKTTKTKKTKKAKSTTTTNKM